MTARSSADVATDPRDTVTVLSPEGKLRTPPGPMNQGQVVEALKLMLLSRAIDDRLTKLQRMGRIALYAPVLGQEAAVVGAAMALDPERDWIVPASREQPAMLHHGLPLLNLFARYMGRIENAAIPAGVKLLPRQEAIGAQIPQAVGLAWALKLRRTDSVALVFFGDGASSEGDFHEASNLAGLMKVPLIFVLINNHYAISTPIDKQTAAKSLAVRAEGYGFRGVTVDGNDLLAVFAQTTAAVGRARAGNGPTLIECTTYRLGFHNTSDNPREYRDDAEVEAAAQLDPIARVRKLAVRSHWWSQAMEEEFEAELKMEIDSVQKAVEQLRRPGPSAIFEHVYETRPPRLEKQRRERLDKPS